MSMNQMQMPGGFPSMDVVSVFTTSFMPEQALKGFPIHTPTIGSGTVTVADLQRDCQGDDVCDWTFHLKEDDGCDTPCKVCVTKSESVEGGFPAQSAKYTNTRNDTECGKFSLSTHHNRVGVTVLEIKREEERNGQQVLIRAWATYSDAELCAGPVIDRNQPFSCDKKDWLSDPSQLDEIMDHMADNNGQQGNQQNHPQSSISQH